MELQNNSINNFYLVRGGVDGAIATHADFKQLGSDILKRVELTFVSQDCYVINYINDLSIHDFNNSRHLMIVKDVDENVLFTKTILIQGNDTATGYIIKDDDVYSDFIEKHYAIPIVNKVSPEIATDLNAVIT